MSPAVAVFSFLTPDFESDRLSVLGAPEDCGVDFPEVLSSAVLPLRIGAGLSFCFVVDVVAGLVMAFGGALVAEAVGGGAYLAVLRYIGVSVN